MLRDAATDGLYTRRATCLKTQFFVSSTVFAMVDERKKLVFIPSTDTLHVVQTVYRHVAQHVSEYVLGFTRSVL